MATLKQYWQYLADDLGDYATFAATSTSVDATDAARQIISTALIDDTANTQRYAFHHVYALDGALLGQQRVVRQAGFTPSTGTLTLSRAFGSTPQGGVNWAMTSRFPIIRQGMRPGLVDFVNRALSEMAVEDYITVSGVTGQIRYSLPTSTNWWILDRGRVLDLWAPYPNSTDRREIDSRAWTILFDGETPVLQISSEYDTGDTFELRVMRPANSRLKTGGAWTDQASPVAALSSDTEEALPPVRDVAAVAAEHAYKSMMQYGPSESVADWERKYRTQRSLARSIRWGNTPNPLQPLSFAGNAPMGTYR